MRIFLSLTCQGTIQINYYGVGLNVQLRKTEGSQSLLWSNFTVEFATDSVWEASEQPSILRR